MTTSSLSLSRGRLSLFSSNAVTQPVVGLDLTALNGLSHRTRAVRLHEHRHVILTEPCVAIRLVLDGETPPELTGNNITYRTYLT